MSTRYAVYFAPAKASPWWTFGAHWLGRDEWTDTALAQPVLAQFDAQSLHAFTAEPRHYGFHATLKAPFQLPAQHSPEALLAQVQALVQTLKPVALGPLQAVALGNFVALVPEESPPALADLAADCVTGLESFRAPLSQADLARRNSSSLDSRGQALLARYGYPHVLERFRLHFTLTGPVEPAVASEVVAAVSEPVARLNADSPLLLDRLSVWREPAPGRAFVRLTDMVLPA